MSGRDKTGNGWVDVIRQEMAGKDFRKSINDRRKAIQNIIYLRGLEL